MSIRRQLTFSLALVLLFVAACSDEAAAPAPSSVSADPAPTVTAVESTETPTPLADSVGQAGEAAPVLAALDWFVDVLNSPSEPTLAEIEEWFSPEFLAQVPPADLIAGTGQILAGVETPLTLESADPTNATGLAAEAVLVSADGTTRLRVSITVDDDAHRIAGLFLQPDIPIEFPDGLTGDELDVTLETLAPNSSIGVYDVTDGACTAVHELRANQPVALGSAFKLWVLAELAHQVSVGDAAWDETMVVTDRYKSSPDGEVFAMVAGTEVTLQRLAELMISISDNSATDHLIARLGRGQIESALVRIGVTDPDANLPFLSTHAMFELKFVAAEPNADDWRGLDEAGRRELLSQIEASPIPWIAGTSAVDLENADGVAIDQPRDLDLEWFATPADLCRTLVHLDQLAETPGLEPVADILEMNAGIGLPFDRERWPIIRFKGGSEPGVLAGAWWFEGDDGSRYVVAGGLSDPDDPLMLEGIVALASAITLVE